jgi:uncharacterized membrane protein HdeD (DUF308 family)
MSSHPPALASPAVASIARLICLLPFGILAAVATITSVSKESWDRLWTIVMLAGITAVYAIAFAALFMAIRRDRC